MPHAGSGRATPQGRGHSPSAPPPAVGPQRRATTAFRSGGTRRAAPCAEPAGCGRRRATRPPAPPPRCCCCCAIVRLRPWRAALAEGTGLACEVPALLHLRAQSEPPVGRCPRLAWPAACAMATRPGACPRPARPQPPPPLPCRQAVRGVARSCHARTLSESSLSVSARRWRHQRHVCITARPGKWPGLACACSHSHSHQPSPPELTRAGRGRAGPTASDGLGFPGRSLAAHGWRLFSSGPPGPAMRPPPQKPAMSPAAAAAAVAAAGKFAPVAVAAAALQQPRGLSSACGLLLFLLPTLP